MKESNVVWGLPNQSYMAKVMKKFKHKDCKGVSTLYCPLIKLMKNEGRCTS